MTLKITPLVTLLFGFALLLVGQMSDLQTQQTTMNVAMCVLAIRSGLSTRRYGLQSNQLCATSLKLQRKAGAVRGIPI
jgi:hypothetical protein